MFKFGARAGVLLVAASVLLSGCLLDFSPDGSQVVYFDMGQEHDRNAPPSSGGNAPKRADLRLGASNASVSTFLEGTGVGIAQQPCWSPDGKTIAYVQENAMGGGVFLFDVQTRKVQKLLATRGVLFLDWKPDGSRLLVARPSEGENFKAFLEWFDPRSKKAMARLKFDTIENDLGVFNQRPVWQPNSNNVFLFSSSVGGMGAVLALPGEGRLVPVEERGRLAGAGVSRDGQKIRVLAASPWELPLRPVFLASRFGESPPRWQETGALDLKRICAPQIPSRIDSAVFSPDGRRIAIVVRFVKGKAEAFARGPQQFALYLMDADGTGAKLVRRTQFFNSETKDHIPVAWFIVRWSRDSQTLGVHFRDAHDGGLFVYDAQGRLKNRLLTPNLSPAPPKAAQTRRSNP